MDAYEFTDAMNRGEAFTDAELMEHLISGFNGGETAMISRQTVIKQQYVYIICTG